MDGILNKLINYDFYNKTNENDYKKISVLLTFPLFAGVTIDNNNTS